MPNVVGQQGIPGSDATRVIIFGWRGAGREACPPRPQGRRTPGTPTPPDLLAREADETFI